MFRKLFCLICMVAVMAVASVYAAPARTGIIQIIQPDGTELSILLHGDEYFRYTTTSDSLPIVQQPDGFYYYADSFDGKHFVASNHIARDPKSRSAEEVSYINSLPEFEIEEPAKTRALRAKAPNRILGDDDVPANGEIKGLVILAEYTDCQFKLENPQKQFDRLLNEKGYSDNSATGSVRDYYQDQSHGKFSLEFDVVGPVKLSRDMAYYGSNYPLMDAHVARMIEEACELADSEFGIDFSKYDNNKNGKADMVYVIYSGYAESNGANTNTVWPHMGFLREMGVNLSLDGVAVDRYACSSELMGTNGTLITGIGLICHEFSHTLGLPDIYSTLGYTSKLEMGTWDVMSRGCYNNGMRTPAGYSSYEKSYLGWLTPTELTETATGVELPITSQTATAYRLTSPTNENEYFLLENRSKSDKWDEYLPGEGLLIIHVDYDKTIWENNQVNAEPNDQHVFIVPANNDFSYSSEETSIPFPGSKQVTEFSDLSTPSSILNDGSYLEKPLSNIQLNDDGVITFDFNQKLQTPVMLVPTNVTETGFVANWEKVEGAKRYIVVITAKSTGESTTHKGLVKNRYTFTKLNPGETYLYKVKAIGETLLSDFSEEKEICLAEAGVVDIQTENQFKVVDGNLVINTSEPITICNILGQVIIQSQVFDDNSLIVLPNGVYLISTPSVVRKIMVK